MEASLDFLLEVGYRFSPTPFEVVTFYLPRLVANITDPSFHRADVYAAEPKDLARDFAPVANSSNGDRWFFTQCRRIKGRVQRTAGGGTWVSQTNRAIKNSAGSKIGQTKNFRFKKNAKYTDWLMDEYHLFGPQQASDLEPVVCRIYVSPRADRDSATHQESAALLRPQEVAAPLVPAPVTITQQQQAPPLKRPAMSAPVVEKPPSAKVPLPRQELAAPFLPAPMTMTKQQVAPLKRPAVPFAETPPCPQKMRGPASAMCVMALPAPPPMTTYRPIDPFEQPPQPLPQESSNLKPMDAAHAPNKNGAERDNEIDDFTEFEKMLFPDDDEVAVAVSPPVVQTVAPNDNEPHEFSNEDMDDLWKLMDDKTEKAVDAGNGCEGDDMKEFARFLEDGLLPNDDKILDVFDGMDDEPLDNDFLNVPLQDYDDKLIF
uniref:NAC domain-containing protein n=1 Tax=Leersia perrieri TaxID=77586 RepID=A0A0D9XYT1_9ORYZ